MKRIDIRISIEYDPDQFPEGDMGWVADKIADCDELYNIGYPFDSFSKTAEVKHHD